MVATQPVENKLLATGSLDYDEPSRCEGFVLRKNMLELTLQGMLSSARSQGLRILLIVVLLLLGSAILAASFSARQPLTVALDIGFTGMRLLLLLMALLWAQELFARDIERKTLYFVLAYPISRRRYLIARYCSAALLTGFCVLLVGGLLWLAVTFYGSSYAQATPPALDSRFIAILFGIWLDLLVVLAFAFFLASVSTTPFLPLLLGLAFALAARGLGPTSDYLRSSQLARADQPDWLIALLEYSFAWLPDLSRLDWRAWALYNLPADWQSSLIAVIMALAYIALLLSLAGSIFSRRNLT